MVTVTDSMSDLQIQCVKTCICYCLLDWITNEWADLVLDVLSRLLPIVCDPLSVRSLSDCYPSPVAESSTLVPPLLHEVFALRAVLRETREVPSECAAAVQTCSGDIAVLREHCQCSYAARPRPAVCIEAHWQLLAKYLKHPLLSDLHSTFYMSDRYIDKVQALRLF
jgi:hypothetical protein